jgi:DUF1009 family protein
MLKKRLGLIAGNGQLPKSFAETALAQDIELVVLGLSGEVDELWLKQFAGAQCCSAGKLRKIIRFFQQHHIDEVVMLGGVNKRNLLLYGGLDWLAFSVWRKARHAGDDCMLSVIAKTFSEHGIEIVSPQKWLSELIVQEGVLTQTEPSAQAWSDIRLGFALGRHMGHLDVGQTLVLRDGVVVAVEALEGTDLCLQRAGVLTGFARGVAVKLAKPQQDLRFDMPTVGKNTCYRLQQAGIKTLALEAGKSLILEPAATLHLADAFGIAIVGLV